MPRVFASLLLLCVPVAAQALPLCPEGEQSMVIDADDAVVLEGPEDLVGEDTRRADGGTNDEILPCALLDAGAYGPLCVDAVGYLITDKGMVLCQLPGGERVVQEPVELTRQPENMAGWTWETAPFGTSQARPDPFQPTPTHRPATVLPSAAHLVSRVHVDVWVPPA